MDKKTLGLRRLALRAQQYPKLLAGLLAAYREREGLDDAHLAEQLGCSLDELTRLALCRRPRSEYFAQDVRQIAAYTGVALLPLVRILRVAEASEAWSTTSGAPPSLAAARDREERKNSPPSEEETSTDGPPPSD